MEHDILQFLGQLSAIQERTLSVLNRKQELLVKPDQNGLTEIAAEEHEVLELLRLCLERRAEILEEHAADSIQSLCQRMLPPHSECLRLAEEAARRSQMIQFQCQTNWVMTRKSVVHLSQMLEIIATRGQGKTTYHRQGEKENASGGGFVDRVA